MTFKSNYDSASKLYNEYLTEIKEIRFTFREIDVISCILHNRGEKKIAAILSISPKTVSAHVYNIMTKLSCNSKDQIIDFIEKSGKSGHFREYYLHLLYKSNFEKILHKIATKLRLVKIKYAVNRNEVFSTNQAFYQAVEKHASIVNCILVQFEGGNADDLPRFDLSKIGETDYYQDFLDYILELVETEENKLILSEIIIEYKNLCKSVEQAYSGTVVVEVKNKTSRKKIIVICTILFIVFGYLIIDKLSSNHSEKQGLANSITNKITTRPEIIDSLEEFLHALENKQFTADNITKEQASKNHSLIKQVERLLEYSNAEEVKEYFVNTIMSSEQLTNYLYNLHAVASYYMYNKHDGAKSNQILFLAKTLVEDYINDRSGVPCKFDELSGEEMLAELEVIKNLPEIYTRIVYSLGRSYIYMDKPDLGVKYFNTAKNLGIKLSLFEGYLSDVRGLLRIEKRRANNYIKENKVNEAIELLENVVKSYDYLKDDNTEYIKDFKAWDKEQFKINPRLSPYSALDCLDMIIANCNKLLEINSNKNSKLNYIEKIEINLQQLYTKDTKFFENKVPARKFASFLNHLGQTYFLLHKFSLKSEKLNYIVKSSLVIAEDKPLAISEILYNKAGNISRNTDYTKANSCEGLIIIYQEQLKQLENVNNGDMEDSKKALQKKIAELTKKRDNINYHLGRTNYD